MRDLAPFVHSFMFPVAVAIAVFVDSPLSIAIAAFMGCQFLISLALMVRA